MLTSVGSGYETKLSVPAPDPEICYGGGGGSPEGRQCISTGGRCNPLRAIYCTKTGGGKGVCSRQVK